MGANPELNCTIDDSCSTNRLIILSQRAVNLRSMTLSQNGFILSKYMCFFIGYVEDGILFCFKYFGSVRQRFAYLHKLLSLHFIIPNINTLLLHTNGSILFGTPRINVLIGVKFVSKINMNGLIFSSRGVVRIRISSILKVLAKLRCALTRHVFHHLVFETDFILLYILLVDFVQRCIAPVVWILTLLFLISLLLLMA